MTQVVFLGPSAELAEARRHLDAVFLPPCRMGDVYRALQEHKPSAIGIIDGYFDQTPAVWHKEILYALSKGVAVFGGASMGALRAAELHVFGMRGVGRIFENYAGMLWEDDDEVAVAHLPAEEGYRNLSVAMANLRHGLELAAREGLINDMQRDALIALVKPLHYPERGWEAVWQAAGKVGLGGRELVALRTFIAERKPDLKREDALAVLDVMREHQAEPAAPPLPSFRFEPTIFWEHLCSHFGPIAEARPDVINRAINWEQLVHHIRLSPPDRKALRHRALLHVLVGQEIRRSGIAAGDDRPVLERFRRKRGLAGARALSAWMTEQQVDQAECLDLAQYENNVRMLEWRYQEAIGAALIKVLKLDGRFGRELTRAHEKWSRLGAMGIANPGEEDVGSITTVLDWYQHRHGAVYGDIKQHILELGFGSPRQFLSELIAEYLSEEEHAR